ncbi:MAG TPA: hypothetical protein VGR07_16285 [Thermoanaerobaculia bacterium]|jgi:hypothetical protein|nr:hypothetical protein [Thermoanaerobaculia bacterium]
MRRSIVLTLAAALLLSLCGELRAALLVDFETPALAGGRQIVNPYFASGIEFSTPTGTFGDEVVGLVKNSATSSCVEPPSKDQKLGTGRSNFPDGSIGLAGFPIVARFQTPLGAPATVAVDFQTSAGLRVRLRLLDAAGNPLAEAIQTAGPARGTCGFPGLPRARVTVTATASQPVASAVMDLADTSSVVFVIDNFTILQTGPNLIRHEPILVYQSVGGFIAGGHHDLLVVYNDGSAVYAKLANQGTFCETGVPKSRVDKLHNDLLQANALLVRDQPLLIADAPLQTVTFLDYPPTAPRGIANTFSFDIPTGPSRIQIEAIVRAFLTEVFPGC